MAITKIQTGGIPALAVTHDKLHTDMDLSTKTVTLPSAITDTITNKLPLAGGAMTGPITTNSTFDGVDIAVRDAILTSTTTTAAAALPKAGGTMTGILTGNRFINATNSSDPWIKGVNTSGVETSYIQQSGNAYFAGNVGIGTSSPGRQLSIVDDGTNGQAIIEVVSANDDVAGIFLGRANNTNIGGMRYFHTNNYLALRSNDVDALIIDSAGNVGIGTTNAYVGGVSGNASLNVLHSTSGQWVMQGRADTNNANGLFIRAGSAASDTTALFTGHDEADVGMKIDGLGRVTTPNQPRVFAQGNINNWTNQSGNQVYTAWQTTGANGSYAVGISYDAATGRFTVPVAGTYYIYSARYVRIGPGYNTNAARLVIRKNGGFWVNKHIHSNENIPDITICIEGLIPMAANDYFTIDDNYASEHYRGSGHTYLHAYLVG